jgi:hypothetical protein
LGILPLLSSFAKTVRSDRQEGGGSLFWSKITFIVYKNKKPNIDDDNNNNKKELLQKTFAAMDDGQHVSVAVATHPGCNSKTTASCPSDEAQDGECQQSTQVHLDNRIDF